MTVLSASRWPVRLLIGLVAGAVIAYVDNVAFEGEASPILIVILLLTTTFIAGALWDGRAWLTSVVVWAWLPLAHLVKHVLGLPDTLQPNTYTSILALAAFTLVIAALGMGGGLLLRRFWREAQ